MCSALNFDTTKSLKAYLNVLDISVKRDRLIEFCQKAVNMPTFAGLEMEQNENEITLLVKGNRSILNLPIDKEDINLDPSNFQENFPAQIYLVFEGLASVFGGTFVVAYEEGEEKKECKVSIIDGVYTHCGERCLVRDVAFPKID